MASRAQYVRSTRCTAHRSQQLLRYTWRLTEAARTTSRSKSVVIQAQLGDNRHSGYVLRSLPILDTNYHELIAEHSMLVTSSTHCRRFSSWINNQKRRGMRRRRSRSSRWHMTQTDQHPSSHQPLLRRAIPSPSENLTSARCQPLSRAAGAAAATGHCYDGKQ